MRKIKGIWKSSLWLLFTQVGNHKEIAEGLYEVKTKKERQCLQKVSVMASCLHRTWNCKISYWIIRMIKNLDSICTLGVDALQESVNSYSFCLSFFFFIRVSFLTFSRSQKELYWGCQNIEVVNVTMNIKKDCAKRHWALAWALPSLSAGIWGQCWTEPFRTCVQAASKTGPATGPNADMLGK